MAAVLRLVPRDEQLERVDRSQYRRPAAHIQLRYRQLIQQGMSHLYTCDFTVENERFLRASRTALAKSGMRMYAFRSLKTNRYQVIVVRRSGRS